MLQDYSTAQDIPSFTKGLALAISILVPPSEHRLVKRGGDVYEEREVSGYYLEGGQTTQGAGWVLITEKEQVITGYTPDVYEDCYTKEDCLLVEVLCEICSAAKAIQNELLREIPTLARELYIIKSSDDILSLMQKVLADPKRDIHKKIAKIFSWDELTVFKRLGELYSQLGKGCL